MGWDETPSDWASYFVGQWLLARTMIRFAGSDVVGERVRGCSLLSWSRACFKLESIGARNNELGKAFLELTELMDLKVRWVQNNRFKESCESTGLTTVLYEYMTWGTGKLMKRRAGCQSSGQSRYTGDAYIQRPKECLYATERYPIAELLVTMDLLTKD